MQGLFLEDLCGMSEDEVKAHIVSSYETTNEDVSQYEILIAYESVGSWGCDSSSFFLLRRKSDGQLFENHASHCSCYGFEGQFTPEETTIEYLNSEKFYVCAGGYDDSADSNKSAIKQYMQTLRC